MVCFALSSAGQQGPRRKNMKRRMLLISTGIVFSLVSPTAQAQKSSSKLEKIASCGPNSLYRRFAKKPEILRGDGGIHIETPRGQIHQDDEDRRVIGDIYMFKFQRWSGEQSFPGGQPEAVAFFRHHCSMPGRGNYPIVIEKK